MPRFEVTFPKGIGFRLSPNLDDRAPPHIRGAKAGEVLDGELVGGGEWLELATGEGLFLPTRAPDGTALLRSLDSNLVRTSKQSMPRQGTTEVTDMDFAKEMPRPPASQPARSDELAGFDRKYDQKHGGRKLVGRQMPAPQSPFGQMAKSHDRTTAYMNEFRDALEDMGVDTRDDQYLQRYAPLDLADAVRTGVRADIDAARSRPGSTGGARPGSRSSSQPTVGSGTGGGASSAGSRTPSVGAVGRSRCGTPEGSGAFVMCGATIVSRSAVSGTEGRWRDGPQNAIVPVKEWVSVKHGKETTNRCSSGRVIDVSDRNVLCMSVLGEKVVLGSADHGLKEINVRAGQQLRNLYTQRFGHKEWVTTVSHCPDGRIVSGGQDSKLCLWSATGVSCVDLTGHLGSISRVRVDGQGKLAVSASYDRTLGVWDLRSKRSVASCTGHSAPVLDFVWHEHIIASGDRSGVVKVWDTNHIQCTGTLKGHTGHITAMCPMTNTDGVPLILTGAQDGQVRVWDLRQKLNTCTMPCHSGGAVNDIGVTARRGIPLCVTTGADGRLMVLEPRAGFRPLHEAGPLTQDFLYSLLVLDDVALVGDGRGNVTCFDLQCGQVKYSLIAGENAIRCLGASASCLVCAGDDGNAVIFDF